VRRIKLKLGRFNAKVGVYSAVNLAGQNSKAIDRPAYANPNYRQDQPVDECNRQRPQFLGPRLVVRGGSCGETFGHFITL
jgi:hypothetical protein